MPNDLVERLRNHNGTAHENETEAADEIERLRAIVDKLPKTKDGVPVVPGMDVWTHRLPMVRARSPFGVGVLIVRDDPDDLPLTVRDSEGAEWDVASEWCYSTREAAEKGAGSAGDGKRWLWIMLSLDAN